MRDETFQCLIDEIGEATYRREVPAEAFTRWQGKLPDQLLRYWRDEGWSGYGSGAFWIVDPDEYEDLVDEWLADTPLEQIDAFHVIARSAFGDLYLCGERSGRSATLLCPLNAVSALSRELKPKTPEDRDRSIRAFFLHGSVESIDYHDESGSPLFHRAVARLGTLAEDEMYGFEPALVAGGKPTLEHMVKVKLDQHLTLLRQFAAPSMPFSHIDIDGLRRG